MRSQDDEMDGQALLEILADVEPSTVQPTHSVALCQLSCARADARWEEPVDSDKLSINVGKV